MLDGRVLIVSHSDPFGIGGGSFACRAYAKAFSTCYNGNVDICIPAESNRPVDGSVPYANIIRVPARSVLSRIVSFFTGRIDRYSGFVIRHIGRNRNLYSLVLINGCRESGSMVRKLRSYGIKVVTVFHNFERDYYRDNVRTPVFREVMLFHIRNLERKAYALSDINLFLTSHDLKKYEETYGSKSSNKVTGVFEYSDAQVPVKPLHKNTSLTFVITGLLCNTQGQDSIAYFFDELYSMLPAGCKVLIAGLDPTEKVISLCESHQNVTLIPNPEDMSEVIAQGDIYICPANTGSGLKLRIMDGLRAGLPVIAHECSSRGYESMESTPFFRSFSTPGEFADAVNALSGQIQSGSFSGQDVTDCYSKYFSFASGLKRIENVLA